MSRFVAEARCRLGSRSKSGAAICPTSSKLKLTNAVAGKYGFSRHYLANEISGHLRKGFIKLAAGPQAVQQHGQLPSHRDDGPQRRLLAALALGQSPLPERRVFAVVAQNMMGALHQQLAHIRIAALGNPQLRVARATLPLLRPQSQKSGGIAAVRQSLYPAQRQHERQRGKSADAGNTFQPHQLRMAPGQLSDFLIVAGELFADGVDLLQQPCKRRAQKTREARRSRAGRTCP